MGDSITADSSQPGTMAYALADGPAPRSTGAERDALKGAAETFRQRQARSDELVAGAEKQIGSMQPPQLAQLPPEPHEERTDPAQTWGSLAMMFAVFGSLATRRPFVSALNSAAAVFNATNIGDHQRAQTELARWKVETQNAEKMAEFQNDQYKLALDKAKTGIEFAKLARPTAAALKDEMVMQLLDAGHYDEAMRLVSNRRAAGSGLGGASEKAMEHMMHMMAFNEWRQQNPNATSAQANEAFENIKKGAAPGGDASKEYSPPQQIEITEEGGKKRQALAQQDKKSGAWFTADENRTPLHADANGSFRILKGSEAAGGTENLLTPRGLEMAATNYRLTGQMPALGFGGPAAARARGMVIDKAAEQAEAMGYTPEDTLAIRSGVHADQQALNILARTRANVTNFEKTADKEADLAKSLMDKGAAQGGVPVVNRWVQAGRTSVAGDPDVASFQGAITSFKNEYARIMSAPGATGGVTSDAARAEADSLINSAMTKEQLASVFNTMKRGMQNRIDAINEEYTATQKRISTAGQKPASPGGVIRYDDQGNRVQQ